MLILSAALLTVFSGGFILDLASAQTDKSTTAGDSGIATEWNPANEFSLTQGGTTGVWNYGYSTSDVDNTLNLFNPGPDTTTSGGCNGGMFQTWRINNADQIPAISHHTPAATCQNIPSSAVFMHPGFNNQRAVLRFNAPASGTFQITGTFQKQNLSATTDLKIIKNAATAGETVLYIGTIGAAYQQSFNLTVTIVSGDKIDFSLGDDGNNTYQSDGSSISVTIGQPVTACLLPPAGLQVNLPAENSPSDVQSVNTNATLAGDASYTNFGKVSRAFELDGDGDYVRVEDNPAQRPATAVTVEGWFKLDSISGIVSLVGKPLRNSAFNSYALYLENGNLKGFFGNNSGQFTRVTSNFTPQSGTWHHLAVTYDFTGGVSTLRLYANGAEVTSGQDGTPNLPLFYDANPYPLLIGGEYENNSPGFYLNGQADEVSIYGRALSQAEIFDLVQQGTFGKCAGAPCAQPPNNMVSWWQGEQNALDSRSNNHGTLQNGATFAGGKVGRAFSLDGVDDRVLIGDPVPASLQIQNEISLNAWIYVTQYPTAGDALGMIVGSQYDVTSSGASIFLDGRTNPDGQTAPPGHIHFQIGDGSFHVTNAQTAVPLNQWVHISANRRAGENARIYYNGVLQPSTSVPWAGSITYTGSWFAIGQQKDINRPFNGLIDEVAIFNRALAQSEVQSIVTAGSTGMCRPSPLNPAANQIGWFSGDGETVDFLGLNPNGILRGDANYRVGRVGQAFNFDGTGDYVEVPDDADHRPANQLTAEGWFRFNSFNVSPHLIAKGLRGSDRNSYVLWYANGNIRMGYSDSGTNFVFYDTGFSPYIGEWNHYAFVLNTDDSGPNANTFKLYIDGREVFSGAAAGPIYYDTVNPHPMTIGADINNDVPDFSLNGYADEVSLYSRALPASEVAAVYNAGAAGKLKARSVTPVVVTAQPNAKNGKGANTESGTVTPTTVDLTDATVTFSNLTTAGIVSQNNVDLGFLPRLPTSLTFTGLAYDVSTTAGYSGTVQVCFNIPALAGFNYQRLRILHLENGVWVTRTAAGNTFPTLCTDPLSSLSPFAIVETLAPSAANLSVGGRVLTDYGRGIANARVTLMESDGAMHTALTGSYGYYRFDGIAANQTVVVSVGSKRFSFRNPSQSVSVVDELTEVNFIAEP